MQFHLFMCLLWYYVTTWSGSLSFFIENYYTVLIIFTHDWMLIVITFFFLYTDFRISPILYVYICFIIFVTYREYATQFSTSCGLYQYLLYLKTWYLHMITRHKIISNAMWQQQTAVAFDMATYGDITYVMKFCSASKIKKMCCITTKQYVLCCHIDNWKL